MSFVSRIATGASEATKGPFRRWPLYAFVCGMLVLVCASPSLGQEETAEDEPPEDESRVEAAAEPSTPPEAPEEAGDGSPSVDGTSAGRPGDAIPAVSVVIDPGESESPQSRRSILLRASAEEKRKRQFRRKATIVITDENLQDYATGDLTIIGPQEETAGEESVVDGDALPAAEDRESYWRGRVSEARRRWRDADDHIPELEAKAARLRWDFYAADDPYYRDSQIKPEWDKTLADLEASRLASSEARTTVAAILEEGRVAGALPGWLREGIEFEPMSFATEDPAQAAPTEHLTREPEIVAEPPDKRRNW